MFKIVSPGGKLVISKIKTRARAAELLAYLDPNGIKKLRIEKG